MTSYFNPRSPRGGATGAGRWKRFCAARFQSTLPTRGSDRKRATCVPDAKTFQSTLPTRGSDADLIISGSGTSISIHAPHEGERRYELLIRETKRDISIHAPHEGERRAVIAERKSMQVFQSTLPTRGSDSRRDTQATIFTDFNPRSPRGGATRHDTI